MEKLLMTLAMATAAVTGANAQAVLGYNASETAGAFTPLDNPTVIFDGATDQVSGWFYRSVITPDGLVENGNTAMGFDLGFEATVADETYTSFLVAPCGYLYLGNGEMGYNAMMGPNFLTYGNSTVNLGFAFNSCDFDANTRICYQTVGEGDDTRLEVQYENCQFSDGSVSLTMDARTVLYRDGRVEVIFGNLESLGADGTINVCAGVRQYSAYVSASGDWGEISTVRNNREYVTLTSGTPAGAAIAFSSPVACTKPSGQPTGLTLTSTSNTIQGTFTPCDGADSYLVTYTAGDADQELPADGTAYKAGDRLGEATVAYAGDMNGFSVLNLDGGTLYRFTVYAMNAYGLDGPAYNTESPLTGSVTTMPGAARGLAVTASSPDSISLSVTSNEADDEVVVLYTPYVERDNVGDHGLFGPLPETPVAGDVIPVPEDFTPYYDIPGAPLPADGGTVAYVGDGGDITIAGLTPGTGYYLAVYTRDEAGRYTTLPLYGGYSTYIECPYDGDSYLFPRYRLPQGWSGSENGDNTIGFVDQEFLNYQTGEVRQGTQIIQQVAALSRGDITDGKEAWMTLPPVTVNEHLSMARFGYCMTFGESRFSTIAYNSWAEGDILRIRVSEDNGETWQTVASYTDAEHPEQPETLSYVDIAANLDSFYGKTILVQLYWKTFANPPFGCNLYVDRFSILPEELPEVPEVTVTKTTHDSAVISWTGNGNDYELAYNVKGDTETVAIRIEGASSYTLTGLEANTEYEVKVRGVAGEGDDSYGEWSETVTFKTSDYPAVDAPENLRADTGLREGILIEWDPATDAEYYEVALRPATSTTWTYTECGETSMLLSDLIPGQDYVCKVRAFCTHDRVTPYSAQIRFTTPQNSSVTGTDCGSIRISTGKGCVMVYGAQGTCVTIHTAAGTEVAVIHDTPENMRYDLRPGVYVVTAGGISRTVAVR